jgi:DNA-binding NtrC family response regulator
MGVTSDTMRYAVERCHLEGMNLSEAKKLLEREWLALALKREGNNQSAVAEKEGVHRNTVARHIRNLDIPVQHQRHWKKRVS